ncbi:hypothetical protein GCM10009077_01480 [Roseibium denhamense]
MGEIIRASFGSTDVPPKRLQKLIALRESNYGNERISPDTGFSGDRVGGA